MALSPSEIQYQLAHINESQGPLCIGVISMFLVIDFAAVSTRLYSKRLTRNKLGWDDYFILAALLLACIATAEIIISCHFGLGRHAIALSPAMGEKISKALFAFEVTYPALNCSVKASILFLYLRIFGWGFKVFQIAWWVNVIWLGGVLTGFYIVTLTQCNPISAFWDVTSTQELCRVSFTPTLVINCFNVISDFGILVLPIPAVWSLQMPLKRKIATAGIFVLGSLAIIVSIVRIPILEVGTSNTDALYHEIPSLILVFAEPTTGILSACLPIMRPLFFRGTRSRTYTGGGANRYTTNNGGGALQFGSVRTWPTGSNNQWSSINNGSDEDGQPISTASTTNKIVVGGLDTGFNDEAIDPDEVIMDHEVGIVYSMNNLRPLEDGLGSEKKAQA